MNTEYRSHQFKKVMSGGVVICLLSLGLIINSPNQVQAQVEGTSTPKPSLKHPPSTKYLIEQATDVLELSEGVLVPLAPDNDKKDDLNSSKVDVEADGITAIWVTIMSEDAEGLFPSDNGWSVYDQNTDSGGDYWDDLSCRYHSGEWSIWAADVGDMVDCNQYDNDMKAWMIYGPFDLSDAVNAELNFYNWNISESDYDYFKWLASEDGVTFNGYQVSGDSGGWVYRSFDLSSYVGDSSLWIAFIFESDFSNTFEGAYVDDIVLRKDAA